MRVYGISLVRLCSLGVSEVIFVGDGCNGAFVCCTGGSDAEAGVGCAGILGRVGAVGASEEQGHRIITGILADVVPISARCKVAYTVLPALEDDVEEVAASGADL